MNKPKLLMLQGLPGCGKSTYAKSLIGWKRVNKDDLRKMIDDDVWSKSNEKQIKIIEEDIVSFYLRNGFNVVIDDTNFAYEEYWRSFAKLQNAEFEVKFFDVPLMECIERDSKRGEKSVGSKVIMKMYNQYLKPEPPKYSDDKQNCYIFDIDGTLAKMNGRSPYDYTKVITDVENINVVVIQKILSRLNCDIIILSGREDSCRNETIEWLKKYNIKYRSLFMRKTGDDRNDAIIKREIYENEIKNKYNVAAVFDDRDRVVAMWRSLGLTCLQVDYGAF